MRMNARKLDDHEIFFSLFTNYYFRIERKKDQVKNDTFLLSAPPSRLSATAMEDETPNARRNSNRHPEWWGDFNQLVKIEKLKFHCISWYKFKLRF